MTGAAWVAWKDEYWSIRRRLRASCEDDLKPDPAKGRTGT